MSVVRLLVLCLCLCPWLSAVAGERPVLLLDLDGPLGLAGSDYVQRGLAEAELRGARLVVLRLDTPGGQDSALQEVMQAILAAPVPVAGFVAPNGARASGAGTYILAACAIAAMAPATRLGAVTPLPAGLPEPLAVVSDADTPVAPPPAADARAYLRALAQLHGRNADWADQAVQSAASLSATEALELDVVNVVAVDIPDLLDQIHGRSVLVQGGEQVLNTAGAPVERLLPDWRNRLLALASRFLWQVSDWLWPLVTGLTLIAVLLGGGLGLYVLGHRHRPLLSGPETLIGSYGRVLEDFGSSGWVQVYGELWQAHSRQPVKKNTVVRVIARHGLILEIQPETPL